MRPDSAHSPGPYPWDGLDGVVRGTWHHADPHVEGVEWRLPDARLTLLIALDGHPLTWSTDPDGRRWHDASSVAVAGPRLRPVLIDRRSQRNLLAVELAPGAARRVFGVPADVLDDPLVAGEELWRRTGRSLQQRLVGARVSDARQVVAAHIRRTAAGDVSTSNPGLKAAVRSLTTGASVGQVANAIGWSSGTLTRSVRQEIGVRPKQLQRLARLESVLQLLTCARTPRSPGPGRGPMAGLVLADVAHATGYADHAHMTREFVALTGMTPSEYLARGASGFHAPL